MRLWPFDRKATPTPARKQSRGAMAVVSAVSRSGFRRGYEAAKRSRLHNGWAGNRSANADIRPALRSLRALSRHLCNNNDYAKRFLHLLKTNVVGPAGIRLQALPLNDAGKVDKPDAAMIEAAWAEFCKPGVCTVDGRTSMVDALRLAIETLARDGELIVRHYDGWKDNRFRYAFGFLESDHLDEDLNRRPVGANGEIRMGIEVNEYNRPRTYYVLRSHPGDDLPAIDSRKYLPLSADQVEHLFLTERAGQVRGVPWFAVSAKTMSHADAYEEAELIAARGGASKMGFFKGEDGEAYEGDDEETDTDEAGVTRTAPVMDMEPGTFQDITGFEFTAFDPQHPTSAYGEFMRAINRRLASGLGVSYVSLANDLKGVSWSSVRYAAIEDRDIYMALQGFLIEHLLTPIFEHWLESAIMCGALKLPLAKLSKFKNVVWQPRRWKWVDPGKEATANEKDLSMGVNSPQRIAGDSHGSLEEIYDEIAQARDLAKKKGILDLFPFLQGRKPNAET